MIYLASPFTHDSAEIRAERIAQVRDMTAWLLMEKKLCVFSPVLYTSTIPDAPIPFEHWLDLNDNMIALCKQFFIFCIDGWKTSRGVSHERTLARALGKPIFYLSPHRSLVEESSL